MVNEDNMICPHCGAKPRWFKTVELKKDGTVVLLAQCYRSQFKKQEEHLYLIEVKGLKKVKLQA